MFEYVSQHLWKATNCLSSPWTSHSSFDLSVRFFFSTVKRKSICLAGLPTVVCWNSSPEQVEEQGSQWGWDPTAYTWQWDKTFGNESKKGILFYFISKKGTFEKDAKKQTENEIDGGKLYPEDAGQRWTRAHPRETELEGIGQKKQGMEYRQQWERKMSS